MDDATTDSGFSQLLQGQLPVPDLPMASITLPYEILVEAQTSVELLDADGQPLPPIDPTLGKEMPLPPVVDGLGAEEVPDSDALSADVALVDAESLAADAPWLNSSTPDTWKETLSSEATEPQPAVQPEMLTHDGEEADESPAADDLTVMAPPLPIPVITPTSEQSLPSVEILATAVGSQSQQTETLRPVNSQPGPQPFTPGAWMSGEGGPETGTSSSGAEAGQSDLMQRQGPLFQLPDSVVEIEPGAESPNIRFQQVANRVEGLTISQQNLQATIPLTQAKPLEIPVGSPGWSDGVGERVQWMASQGIQRAEIHVHPKELGPMEIRLTMRDEVAQVSIHAAHAATREAVDASIPRLREMMAEANVNLGSVDVGQRETASSQQQGRGAGQTGGQTGSGYFDSDGSEEMTETRPQLRSQGRGLVDDFA